MRLFVRSPIPSTVLCANMPPSPTPQVALLFICDTVNCAFDITFLYIPLVNNFGELPRARLDRRIHLSSVSYR